VRGLGLVSLRFNAFPVRRWGLRVLAGALAATGACALLPGLGADRAQAPGPSISSWAPLGGQRGTSTTVRITGEGLRGASVVCGRPGVRAAVRSVAPGGDSAEVVLALPVDAAVGPLSLRIVTPKGVSRPAWIWVDPFPSVPEREPNDDPSEAGEAGRVPAGLTGTIDRPGDCDSWRAAVRQGAVWAFDCVAARAGSALVPVVEVRDAAGRVLASATEEDGPLVHRFAWDGVCFVSVRDARGGGGAGYAYRLVTGPVPVIQRHMPLGERPGEVVGLEFEGANLGRTRRARVAIPRESAGVFWASVETEHGPSLPIALLVDPAPVLGHTETDATMPLPAEAANLDGVFQRFPSARFFFRGVPGRPLTIRLSRGRAGSPVVGRLVLRAANGAVLASAEGDGGREAILLCDPPAAGLYTLEALNSSGRTGPDCAFRLSVRPALPDFRLLLDDDRVLVPAGGTALVRVAAERLHGHAAAISLVARGAPAGVEFRGGTAPPGASFMVATFTATAGAQPGTAGLVRLRGISGAGSGRVTREAAAGPPAENPGRLRPDAAEAPALPVAVVEDAGCFRLTIAPGQVTLPPGGRTELTVRAVRQPGPGNAIGLDALAVPAGVSLRPGRIAAGRTTGRLQLAVQPGTPAGAYGLAILGRMGDEVRPAPLVRVLVLAAKRGTPRGQPARL